MKKIIIFPFILMSLVACDAGGNLGVEGSPLWHMRTSAKEKAEYFGAICSNYGFKYNTPEMSQCIAQETRSNKKSNSDNMNKALDNMNNSYPKRTNCTTFGNQINCTTF
jgi:hypothetical protein